MLSNTNNIITTILILILMYEIYKYLNINNLCSSFEGFEENTPGEYESSISTTEIIGMHDDSDKLNKFVKLDKDIFAGSQKVGAIDRIWKVKYIKGQNGTYILLTAVITVPNKSTPVIKKQIMQLQPIIYQSGSLFDANNMLLLDNRFSVKYYVKFLSNDLALIERRNLAIEQQKFTNFEKCKTNNKGMGLSTVALINKCAAESGYNP